MSLLGYDQGVFNGVVITQDFLETHNLVGPSKTKDLSTVTAIYDVRCFFGAVVAFSTILQTTSFSLPQMFVGRIILGVGKGINTATAPIWQTETSQLKWRGGLVILAMMMNITGFCLVNWINYGFSFAGSSVAWRFPLAFQFMFLFVLRATTPWLPESSRWLLAHGKEEEAIEVLSCLEAKPIDDPRVLLKKDKKSDTKTLRRLFLGIGTQFVQRFGGINVMSYYMPTVLTNSVGLPEKMARLLSACNAVSYLIFSGLAILFVERMGRRVLMLSSTVAQFVCFLIITI
ncbi:Major facilitator superfamily domain general substrate transporter [Penicillium antarcticum]|uniref:Major facilitator superfamily domain general substrate transporter n=1 Tax=Penicillium antarcticum TaxID=416450 RepID=UPI0023897A35|nr:Major facilitator superfamily domain general substrate transporter [Penicillium antarcticum]KAJ5293623.1 Major facilitator superfamily domain general substrate transporter [Penicillium antarcticum]